MKRLASAVMTLGLIGTTVQAEPFMSSAWNRNMGCCAGGCRTCPTVPDVVGPWGQPVPMAAPYSAKPPDGAYAARAMLSQSLPLDIVQMSTQGQGMGLPGTFGPSTMASPPGVGAMPGMPAYPVNPAATPRTSGIQRANFPMHGGGGGLGGGLNGPPGAVAAVNSLAGAGGGGAPFQAGRTEVRFVGPAGMKISWYGAGQGGQGAMSTNYIEAPGRYNFVQAAIYRLKLSDIPNRPGLELYPTLEVVPANMKTATFLAHAAVPIHFTEEDFEQVASGNFVVKVIYLPDPRFQDLATSGPDEVVSSRLEPGVDPIAEACRRGSILTVVRIGNIDLEAPNTPAMDAPSQYAPRQAPPQARPGAGPGGAGPGPMVPGTLAGRPGMMMGPNGPMMPPGGGGMLMPMPGAGGMQQQMMPNNNGVPMMPNNGAMPMMPMPQQQQQPTGPVGQMLPAPTAQPAGYAVPAGVAMMPAQIAAQEAGTPTAASTKPVRRSLFSWGSSKPATK